MALSRDFNLPAARSTLFTGSCLHQRSLHSAGKLSGKGFSLIEVLMVILVMGILCGTGISITRSLSLPRLEVALQVIAITLTPSRRAGSSMPSSSSVSPL